MAVNSLLVDALALGAVVTIGVAIDLFAGPAWTFLYAGLVMAATTVGLAVARADGVEDEE